MAASGLTTGPWPAPVVVAAIVAVAVAGAFWWSYFTGAKADLDHALERSDGSGRSRLARDAFSIMHFPILCGVIAYAESVSEILAHPSAPLPTAGRWLLSGAVLLFAGGTGLSLRRAQCRVTAGRIWLPVATAAVTAVVPGVPAVASLAIVLTGMLLLALAERGAGRPAAAHSSAV